MPMSRSGDLRLHAAAPLKLLYMVAELDNVVVICGFMPQLL